MTAPDYEFSREPLTLQERIWLFRVQQGDPEALLSLLYARCVTPVTTTQLLTLPGVMLDALIERCTQGICDAISGKALIDKHGLM